MTRILIVEDDEAIAAGLAMNMTLEGYLPTVVHDGGSALAALREEAPDLVVLDIGLPDKNGLMVLQELRQAETSIPVIILSARHEEFDKVAALRLGADDYVTKPFALAELLARVHAVLRRVPGRARTPTPPPVPAAGRRHTFGDVEVDLDTRTAARQGAAIALTHLEFELLIYFVQRPAQVFSREQLLKEVWGVKTGSTRTVDNFVAQLRAKLEADPDHPRHLVTVRGSGYRFDP
jgi:two-component system, OmpR family, alkaline phosphatase synthesis response regulator PhoP